MDESKNLTRILIAVSIILILIVANLFTTGPSRYINMHEHMENMQDVEPYLKIAESHGITKTLLVGSSDMTLYSRKSFTNYDKNNEALLDIKAKYPKNFEVLCTTYWNDPDQVEKAKKCWEKGAKGIKLYNGHANFYSLPLDDPKMLPLYAFIEKNGLILLFHVNGTKYMDEFKRVLDKYPNMKVICPHYCLISKNLKELSDLMDKYPNLYTDVSFGYIDYTVDGFDRTGKYPEKFTDFIKKYKDRVFLGTDQVVTNIKTESRTEFLDEVIGAYVDMLTKSKASIKITWPKPYDKTFTGLDLDNATLETMLIKAPQKLLDSVPNYTPN